MCVCEREREFMPFNEQLIDCESPFYAATVNKLQ